MKEMTVSCLPLAAPQITPPLDLLKDQDFRTQSEFLQKLLLLRGAAPGRELQALVGGRGSTGGVTGNS